MKKVFSRNDTHARSETAQSGEDKTGDFFLRCLPAADDAAAGRSFLLYFVLSKVISCENVSRACTLWTTLHCT